MILEERPELYFLEDHAMLEGHAGHPAIQSR